jgi:hypothetical protein
MSANQQNPQGPENGYDPAGSTQMFRAFVDEQPQQNVTTQRAQARPRVAVIAGMVVGLLIVVGVVALAIK